MSEKMDSFFCVCCIYTWITLDETDSFLHICSRPGAQIILTWLQICFIYDRLGIKKIKKWTVFLRCVKVMYMSIHIFMEMRQYLRKAKKCVHSILSLSYILKKLKKKYTHSIAYMIKWTQSYVYYYYSLLFSFNVRCVCNVRSGYSTFIMYSMKMYLVIDTASNEE